VEGGDPVVGQLGSYTWADGGSDSPWLPGTPISAGAGEPLTVTIGDGVAIAGWTARRVPAGATNGTGAVGLGAGGTPVTFAAPGRGTWSVQVAVVFAADLGSAAYYWRSRCADQRHGVARFPRADHHPATPPTEQSTGPYGSLTVSVTAVRACRTRPSPDGADDLLALVAGPEARR
jgi:hypothetical protein